jgi:hypothetical protein
MAIADLARSYLARMDKAIPARMIAYRPNRGIFGMSLQTAALISDAANWALLTSLIVGMISTILIMWTANIKDNGWLTSRQAT